MAFEERLQTSRLDAERASARERQAAQAVTAARATFASGQHRAAVDELRAFLAQEPDAPGINAEIDRLFTSRGVRPQFIKDWQMRTGSQPGVAGGTTRYPASVTFLLYAAGTFMRGNGLQLDLGVVRDSVLNAENDYTAGWMEECHLIARLGHEARAFTANVCAAGRTGAHDLTACRT